MDPIRLRVGQASVLLRTWDSESLFNSYMAVGSGLYINPEEHRHDRFVTVESDGLDDASFRREFLIGFSDWGSPSFTTFSAHPQLPLLACGCNSAVYLIDSLSGEVKQFQLFGFFRYFIAISPHSLILEAEAGIYNLSWNLELSWHASTDLIQSAKLDGPYLLLETDSGSARLDLQTGKYVP